MQDVGILHVENFALEKSVSTKVYIRDALSVSEQISCLSNSGPHASTVQISGRACARNTRNVFPATIFKGRRELPIPACITAHAWPLSVKKPMSSKEIFSNEPRSQRIIQTCKLWYFMGIDHSRHNTINPGKWAPPAKMRHLRISDISNSKTSKVAIILLVN